MSREKIVANALHDYELYQKDFNDFSTSTLKYLNSIDIFNIYLCTLIFKNWKDGIIHIGFNNLNEIFDELHQDVNSSYYLASMGLYRTANMHLRSTIELSLQLLYFYDHPIELKKWKNGGFIIKHDKLKDYLKDYPYFKPPSKENEISILIEQISREWKNYSKHIHAESINYFQTQNQSHCNKSFDIPIFERWKSNFIKIIEKINNLFKIFFSEKLKLFPSQNKELLFMI